MAYRTTGTLVKEIITTSVSVAGIEPFIIIANQLVTSKLGSSTDLSDLERDEIERWLAAHFLAVSLEQKATTKKIGDAEKTYQGRTAMDLKATFYGQTACILDTTGALERLGKQVASIIHLNPDMDSTT